MPHPRIAKLREPQSNLFVVIFQPHLHIALTRPEVAVDFESHVNFIVPVLHQFPSHNEHVGEEEDTNRGEFLHSLYTYASGRTPGQEKPLRVWILSQPVADAQDVLHKSY